MVDERKNVAVHVEDDVEVSLDWCHTKRIELKLDQAVTEEQFKAIANDGGGLYS